MILWGIWSLLSIKRQRWPFSKHTHFKHTTNRLGRLLIPVKHICIWIRTSRSTRLVEVENRFQKNFSNLFGRPPPLRWIMKDDFKSSRNVRLETNKQLKWRQLLIRWINQARMIEKDPYHQRLASIRSQILPLSLLRQFMIHLNYLNLSCRLA